MFSIFRNKNLISLFIMVIFILWIAIYLKGLVNKTNSNFQSLSSYGKSIISNNEMDVWNIWNFKINIGWESIVWNSLSDFINKINSIYQDNLKKNILIKINDNDWKIVKVYEYTYNDFSYSINTKDIIEKIKFAVINWEKTLVLNLEEYIYFDNKKFNENLNKLKQEYTENNLWEIYLDKDNDILKVNNNKIYLTSIKDIKLDIEKVNKKLSLKWSEINIYLESKENDLFKKADEVNKRIKKIMDTEVTLNIPDLNGFNVNVIKNYFKKNKSSYTLLDTKKGLTITLKKWFLASYYNFNKDNGNLEFLEDDFWNWYSFLKWFKIVDDWYQVMENPSIFSNKDGALDENKPLSEDFRVLSPNKYIDLDFVSLIKEIKIIFWDIDKTETSTFAFNDVLKLKDINSSFNIDLNLVNSYSIRKDQVDFFYKKWLYRNGYSLGEKYINLGTYPYDIENATTDWWCTTDKASLYCWWSYVGKFKYDNLSVYIKELNKVYLDNSGSWTWIKRINSTLLVTNNDVALTNWVETYRFNVKNKIGQIINDFNSSLVPEILTYNYKKIVVNNDKLKLSFKTNKNEYLLIKEDEDNYLFYIFTLNVKNEQ